LIVAVLVIIAVAGVILLLGGRFYAPVIGRVLGERHDRVTPAAASRHRTRQARQATFAAET
jgi:carbon starvation protein CstA